MKLYHVYHDYGYGEIGTIAICTKKIFAYEIMEQEKARHKQTIAIDEYEADTICDPLNVYED